MTQPSAIEITTFQLAGCSCDEFIATNADLDVWLRRQPGFQSRHLTQQDDGGIVDILFWASAEQGRASMHRLMDELRDSPVHAMIDQSTVSWNISALAHQLKRR